MDEYSVDVTTYGGYIVRHVDGEEITEEGHALPAYTADEWFVDKQSNCTCGDKGCVHASAVRKHIKAGGRKAKLVESIQRPLSNEEAAAFAQWQAMGRARIRCLTSGLS